MFSDALKFMVSTLALLAMFRSIASAVPPQVPPVIETPGVYGDQLFFFFDARSKRVPFLTVANLANSDIRIEIAYYSEDLEKVVALENRTLVANGNIVMDPTTVSGVVGNAGLAVVTPVVAGSDQAVVPPGVGQKGSTPPLAGAFTLANTDLGSGFGQSPLARVAVNRRGERPKAGLPVDGVAVRYQRFAPDALVVPTYFRPDTLSPPSKDGNRIILAAFRDAYGHPSRIRPTTITFDVAFDDAEGKRVASRSNLLVSGVHLDTLQSLAGRTTLKASGKIWFTSDGSVSDDENLFGLVSQSLGTFSVGQRMSGIFLADHEPEKLIFVAEAVQNASFGGLLGADSICQQDAKAAGLPGIYLAWMSDSKSSPSTRFTRSTVPYVMPNGVSVAEDWGDLTNGPDGAINITADGGSFPDRYVYTNTDMDGTPVETAPSKICDDWTSSASPTNVAGGDTMPQFVGAWTRGDFISCGPAFPVYGIYCFEQ